MINKILSNITKKKAGAIVLTAAIVATLSAVTVFAASSMNTLQVKTENGIRSYSVDNGKTWSQNAPEGVTVCEEDGKLTITKGFPSEGGEGNGLLTKMEDGVRLFSTDGGKTWSKKTPEAVKVREDDGRITITRGIPTKDAKENEFMSKIEDGVRYFSTDGGKTWSKDVPEDVTVSEENGKITITKGIPDQAGNGQGMLIKVEDGVRYFSTDGGNTWSETAPEGLTINDNGSVTIKN